MLRTVRVSPIVKVWDRIWAWDWAVVYRGRVPRCVIVVPRVRLVLSIVASTSVVYRVVIDIDWLVFRIGVLIFWGWVRFNWFRIWNNVCWFFVLLLLLFLLLDLGFFLVLSLDPPVNIDSIAWEPKSVQCETKL